jgi:hypothetical protein
MPAISCCAFGPPLRWLGESWPVTRHQVGSRNPDTRFDRVTTLAQYGTVALIVMLLRGLTMPRPIPVPIRQTMFRLWKQGCGTRQIVASLGLPCSTVRRLLRRFRLRDRDGISPDYRYRSATFTAPSEMVQTAVQLRREHPTWGAGLVPVHEPKVTNAQNGVEPQAYFEGASVDPTDARKPTVRRFGRSDRRAQRYFVLGRQTCLAAHRDGGRRPIPVARRRDWDARPVLRLTATPSGWGRTGH